MYFALLSDQAGYFGHQILIGQIHLAKYCVLEEQLIVIALLIG